MPTSLRHVLHSVHTQCVMNVNPVPSCPTVPRTLGQPLFVSLWNCAQGFTRMLSTRRKLDIQIQIQGVVCRVHVALQIVGQPKIIRSWVFILHFWSNARGNICHLATRLVEPIKRYIRNVESLVVAVEDVMVSLTSHDSLSVLIMLKRPG